MKSFSAREIRNKSLHRRYNGFIMEKKNCALLREFDNEVDNPSQASQSLKAEPNKGAVINASELDNNSHNDTSEVTVQAKGAGDVQRAVNDFKQGNLYKTLKSQGKDKDVDVRVVDATKPQKPIATESISRPNGWSVKFTKSELNKILFN